MKLLQMADPVRYPRMTTERSCAPHFAGGNVSNRVQITLAYVDIWTAQWLGGAIAYGQAR